MGTYTRLTRAWLDQRYRRTTEQGVFVAHQPIYGLGHPASEPNHLPRMARTYQILRVLNRLRFESFLDVGAAEGYLAHLVGELFGAEVLVGDLSVQAAHRANELFGLEGVALDSARLPFRDDAFDLVVCSEVVEHVEFPVDVMLELDRVAGSALVLTTEEVTGDDERLAEHATERRDFPHAERNLFHIRDLELIFGTQPEYRSQYVGDVPGDSASEDDARAWIRSATGLDGWDPNGVGVILTSLRGTGEHCEPRVAEEVLLDAVLRAAREPAPIGALDAVVARTEAHENLRSKMTCPFCMGRLRWAENESEVCDCTNCGKSFGLIGGVPALYDESAPDPSSMDLESHLLIEGDDPEKIDSIMDMRDRMQLPDATTALTWDFESEDDRKAWTADGDLEQRDGAGNGSHWLASGADPRLVGPMLVLPDGEALELSVEMRIHNPDFPADAGEGQVFWMGMGDLSFHEENSIHFPVINDGQVHTYSVPLAEHANWPAEGGLWLRLDPVNGPAEVDLLSLRLVAKQSEPAVGDA